jgi:enoyl-CoA hydratase/carnithine racemase
MRTDYQTLRVEMHGAHVLIVTLNRPEVANALNTQMGRDLLDLWTGLIAEPGAVRAAILTGAGGRVFCAGGDLKERNGMTKAQWEAQHEIFERQYWALLDCPMPVIAAVNGPAYAGGCEMTLACDFAYAVPAARFALTEVTLGIMPGAGGTQLLPRAVGERQAVHCRGRAALGHRKPTVSAGDLDPRCRRDRRGDRRQRAALRAPGQEVDPSRPADGPEKRPAVRNRGV